LEWAGQEIFFDIKHGKAEIDQQLKPMLLMGQMRLLRGGEHISRMSSPICQDKVGK
jgi:hypothetical protein